MIQIEEHYPLVERIAAGIARRLPRTIDVRDLVQAGMVGLLEARSRYEEGMGTRFEVFAMRRIRGSILDTLRGQDNCARSVRKEGKRILELQDVLTLELGRKPESDELARACGISLSDLHKTMFLLESSKAVHLQRDDDRFGKDEDDPMEQLPAPERETVEVDDIERLERWTSALEPRLRKVIRFRYMEDMPFTEIGRQLGVGETRAYQLHTQAIVQIRCMARAEM